MTSQTTTTVDLDRVLVLAGSTDPRSAASVRMLAQDILRQRMSGRSIVVVWRHGEHADGQDLADALATSGISATVLRPEAVGPVTRGPATSAEPRRLNVAKIVRELAKDEVVILRAGIGVDEFGSPTVLASPGVASVAGFVADRMCAEIRVTPAAGLSQSAATATLAESGAA